MSSAVMRREEQGKPELVVLGAAVLTLALAATQSSGQDTIVVLALLGTLPLVIVSSHVRLVVLTFGGLLAFQSSVGVGLLKSTYLVVVFTALLAAMFTVGSLPDRRAINLMKPMLVTTALFAAVVALSLAVAIVEGTPLADWLRDASPYFLFCSVPIFALDFSSHVSRRYLISVLIAVGVLAALSGAIDWAGTRRQYFQFAISHLLLPSGLLATALVCFSTSRALTSAGAVRAVWAAFTGAVLALVALLTGTRSFSVVLLLVPLMVSVALPGGVIARLLQVSVFTVLMLAAGLGATFFALQVTGSNPQSLVDRFATVAQFLSSPTQDPSYQLRQQEFDSAMRLFQSSPLVGTGPGHLFDWASITGEVVTTFNIDTGMEVPAKFGLVGVAALLAIGVALFVVLKKMALTVRARASTAAVSAFATVGAIWLLFGSPLEDKGFSYGMILLLALALADCRDPIPILRMGRSATVHRRQPVIP